MLVGFVVVTALRPRPVMRPMASSAVNVSSEQKLLAIMTSSLAAVWALLVATRADGSCMLLREVVAGGTAAAMAEVLLYPLEIVKVKRQTGGVVRASDLWRRPGVVAGVARALAYHGLRLGVFPFVNHAFPGGDVGRKLAVGAACGALGSALCNPLDLAKTRLQRDPGRYRDSLDALCRIPGEERGGLFIGAPASVARAAAGSSAQLVAYDVVKSALIDTAFPAVLVATLAATLAYATAAAPFDVVKSRLMVCAPGDRPSPLGCALTILRTDGPIAFFTGWLPAVLRLLPTSLLVFPLLERFRVILGAGAF